MIPRAAFFNAVRKHTDEARRRWGALDIFGAGDGWSSKHIAMSVLTEEIGKMARCMSKLELAEDAAVRKHWNTELGVRCISAASMCERIAGFYAEEPPR